MTEPGGHRADEDLAADRLVVFDIGDVELIGTFTEYSGAHDSERRRGYFAARRWRGSVYTPGRQRVGELTAGVEHQSHMMALVVAEQATRRTSGRDRGDHLAVGLVADRHTDRRQPELALVDADRVAALADTGQLVDEHLAG